MHLKITDIFYGQHNNSAILCIAKMLCTLLSILPLSSCVSWSPQAKSPIPRMLASR